MFDELLDIEKACRKILFEDQSKVGRVPNEEHYEEFINSTADFLREKCGALEENFNVNNSLKVALKNDRDALTIKVLLELGADVNHVDSAGNFPLIIASRKGHKNIIKTIALLLEKGANIHQQNYSGDTALMVVARRCGHIQAVKLLLAKGSNILHQNNSDNTALVEAALCWNINIVKLLLKEGANIHYQNRFSKTPLLIVVESDYPSMDIIKLFLAEGADITHEDKYGDSALKTVLFTKKNIAKLFIEHTLRINPETNLQKLLGSSRSSASVHDRKKIIIELIRHGEEYRKALNNIADKVDPSMNNGGRLSSDISALADGKDGNTPTVPSSSTQSTVVFPPSVSGNSPRENAH